jgi:molybdopterin-guanine dinucleotide biosynthesis protein A
LRFARTRLPVVADVFANNLGPLAGIHAGFTWMKAKAPNAEWLISFASDTPFFPSNLVEELLAAKSSSTKIVVATSKLTTHSVFALWHVSLKAEIETQLETGDAPRLQDWMKTHNATHVDFNSDAYDPFFNINTPQDLYAAEPMAALVK